MILFRRNDMQLYDGLTWEPAFAENGVAAIAPLDERDIPVLLLIRIGRFRYRWHIAAGIHFSYDSCGGVMWAWSTWAAREMAARRLDTYRQMLMRP